MGDEGVKECTPVHPGLRPPKSFRASSEGIHLSPGLESGLELPGLCLAALPDLKANLRPLLYERIWLLKIRGVRISTNLSSEELFHLQLLLARNTAWFRPHSVVVGLRVTKRAPESSQLRGQSE